ncbi:hypothetical protein BVU17_17235 [Haloarcula taiwanensis]|uniref:Uncharacterized protein n=1 Tax=Haloarcula taiwanensis TaxID=1932004 RepID=A0A2H5A3K9_9EURY|nr:hypothetical protein [Haloarcula taiwanensis]AUG49311.1 hypothetical protein BVU17_17235 [Haloarcula taiwanensis]
MGSVARQFWLMIVPSLTSLSTMGLLIVLALFPERLFTISTAGYIATAAVAFVSLGILVWQLSSSEAQNAIGRPEE